MVFSSVVFLFLFLPLVLVCYFIVPNKVRNIILLLFSLLFYAWGEPVYILIMIASTVCAYFFGRRIGYYLDRQQKKSAKRVLIFSIVVHLGILIFFKYTDFFIVNLNRMLDLNMKTLDLALPIGISFYTFQILSYLIDVYWGKVKVQKNFVHLATYVSLFPQLIAGPIVRYQTVEEELSSRTETLSDFAIGVRRFILGLGKKVLLANTLGELFTTIHALPDSKQSVVMLWLGALAFTAQIYYDFSGYSDMAIGLGRMFGFHFLENFHYPYVARSITDFWRRWHISLSSWFKDYVYIPLGGNRKGLLCQYRNIFIVWLLTGFWHGAEWTFILWGVFFGILLMMEKSGGLRILQKLPVFVQHVYTMFFVVISWTIFSADNLQDLLHTLKGMFFLSGLPLYNGQTNYYLCSYFVLFLFAIIGSTPLLKNFYEKHILVTKKLSKNYTYVMGSLNTAGDITTNSEEKYIAAVNEHNKMSHWDKQTYDDIYRWTKSDYIKTVFELLCLFGVFLLSIAYLVSASFNPFLYFRF